MNNLVVHNYGFSLIPPLAEKGFIEHLNYWYECMAEEEIPYFENEMFTQNIMTYEIFGDFFYEIRQYTYAIGRDDIEFSKGQFPVDAQKFIDYALDEEQAYYDTHWEIESQFVNDMKKYLNANRMFYEDLYAEGNRWIVPKSKFYNIPICEVW